MGGKKGVKQKPNGENKKRIAIRLYPYQLLLIKSLGESAQEFMDRCVDDIKYQSNEENS
jgi:hypothetical protein